MGDAADRKLRLTHRSDYRDSLPPWHCCTCGGEAEFVCEADVRQRISNTCALRGGTLHNEGFCLEHAPKELVALWAMQRVGT